MDSEVASARAEGYAAAQKELSKKLRTMSAQLDHDGANEDAYTVWREAIWLRSHVMLIRQGVRDKELRKLDSEFMEIYQAIDKIVAAGVRLRGSDSE